MKVVGCVLTLNEEQGIIGCLESLTQELGPACKLLVVDSGSSDATRALAENFGAEVVENAWPGFAAQRNFALECVPQDHWVVFLDADERLQPGFGTWLASAAQDSEADVFWLPSALHFIGRRLKFAPGYPILHPRLLKPGIKDAFVEVTGAKESIAASLRQSESPVGYEHYICDRGEIDGWLLKHFRLSELELSEPQDGEAEAEETVRSQLSRIAGRSLVRPFLRFVYHYVVRQGFRDGRPGLIYSAGYAWYELSIWLRRSASS